MNASMAREIAHLFLVEFTNDPSWREANHLSELFDYWTARSIYLEAREGRDATAGSSRRGKRGD